MYVCCVHLLVQTVDLLRDAPDAIPYMAFCNMCRGCMYEEGLVLEDGIFPYSVLVYIFLFCRECIVCISLMIRIQCALYKI